MNERLKMPAQMLRKKWEIVNSFLNKNEKQYSIPTIQYNNDTYDSPLEIADALSNYFFHTDVVPSSDYHPFCRLPPSLFLFPTTSHKILDVIRNLETTNAGIDDIHHSHIKMITHAVSDILATVINLAFRTGISSVQLKSGKVVSVFKEMLLHANIQLWTHLYTTSFQ